MNLVAQVVKGQQAVEEHQFAIGQREIVLSMFADFLQLPYYVVGKITYGPGGEWRQAGNRGWLVLAQQQLHELEHVSLVPFAVPSAFNFDGRTARSQAHIRPRSQEGVAADLFAALDRLQEKRVGFAFRN